MGRTRLTALTAAVALAVTLAVTLAGCSGGGKKDAAGSATTKAGSASTAPSGGAGTRPPGANPFCDAFRTFNDRFGRINLGLADPQQFRTAMQEAGTAIKNAQGAAPDAIKSDVTTVSDGFQKLLAALQQANFDLTRLSPTSLQQLQAPEFTGATQRVGAYVGQNCQ